MNNITFAYTLAGTVNPYVTAAGTTVIGRAPVDGFGGGVTLTHAAANVRAGTATFAIVDLGASGTVNGGTICSIAAAGDVVKAGDPANYFLDGGNYIGFVTSAGTVTLPGGLWVNGIVGR